MMMKGLERRLAAEASQFVEEAGKLHTLMQEVIQHTHNLARQFSSLDVKGDNLATVLEGLGASVEKLFGIRCKFCSKGPLPGLPHNTTVQLYKIAQEAVSNAIKHGKASEVVITLSAEENRLAMTVKNDGAPFSPPTTNSTRMGLRIVRTLPIP